VSITEVSRKGVAVPIKQPPELLFWRKVKRGSPDECWLWQGGKRGQYGSARYNGRSLGAHQVSYILHYGPIPDGLDILHSCDNPLCVNPKHLRAGTHLENMRDMINKGRDRHPHGEALPTNIKLNDEKVREIRKLIVEGVSHREIGRRFGITDCAVSYIRNRKRWAHVD